MNRPWKSIIRRPRPPRRSRRTFHDVPCEVLESRRLLTDFYVDPVNGSDDNPGTLEAPFETVRHLSAAFADGNVRYTPLEPGDTVFLRDGVHDWSDLMLEMPDRDFTFRGVLEIQGRHGTAESPITITAFPGERPILTGKEGTVENAMILVLQSSYVTISGLEIRDTFGGGIFALETTETTIVDNHIHDVDGLTINNIAGVYVQDTVGLHLHRNLLHDNFDRSNPNMNSRNVVIFGTGMDAVFVSHNKVFNTTVDGQKSGGAGIWVKHGSEIPGATLEFHDNIVRDVRHTGIGGVSAGIRMYNNLLINAEPYVIVGGDNLLTKRLVVDRVEISDNTFVDTNVFQAHGLDEFNYPDHGFITVRDNIISNSTQSYHQENGILQWEVYGTDENYRKAITLGNLDFDGNIYHNKPAAPTFNIFAANGGNFGSLGANLSVTEWQALGVDQNSTTADPQLDADYIPQAAIADGKGWLSSDHPRIVLFVNDDLISETDGANASRVMIARSGMDLSQPLTVQLSTSDVSDATVPAVVTIPAGEAIAYAPISAIDDNKIEPTRGVQIFAETDGGLTSSEWIRVLQDGDGSNGNGGNGGNGGAGTMTSSSVGRGQDLLLLVNPESENSVRIAGVYQQLRNIPDNNVVFVTPPRIAGFDRLSVPAEEFWTDYVATVRSAIHDRGLADQIDFIAAVGQPHSFNETNDYYQSLSFGLMQLDQYFAGMTVPAAHRQSNGLDRLQQSTALHHSDTYNNVTGSTTGTHQYYVAGLLGVSEQLGNTADQIIAGLQRSAAADGTHPVGTVYFEENGNIRSDVREWQWDAVQADLTARGVPFVEESDVSGGTPMNRTDVRGAVVGNADARLPNSSTYLPGSWADNLTSFGGGFGSRNQTKATEFIAAGAAASSGTVFEPGGTVTPLTLRFPHAEIFSHIDAGLTLGEAFYQSVVDPDMIQFIGDILAQPYADTPTVTITGPQDGDAVSGTLALAAAATVPANGRATAVSRLELYVNGRLHQTQAGNAAQFTVNTASLPDGEHEFRVVAVANNAAESEGVRLLSLRVNNSGRSVATAADRYVGADRQVVDIPVTLTTGGGIVDRVELRHLGRVVATRLGAAASVGLNLQTLAFGDNRVVPVAIFAGGVEVRGSAFVVNREPTIFIGGTIPAAANQTPGIRAEYFVGDGSTSIAAANFSGTPDIDTRHEETDLFHNAHGQTYATTQIDGLAVRLTGSFTVEAGNAGEYLFSALNTSDSLRIRVDRRDVLGYDNLAYGLLRENGSAAVFLGAGRHDFEILQANTGTEDGMRTEILVRGPDGITKTLNDSFVYTVSNNSSLDAPQITAPTGTVSLARPEIRWTAVAGADGYDIRVINAANNSEVFTTQVQTTNVTPNADLANGTYTVSARTRLGTQMSPWATQTFQIHVVATAGNDFFEDFEDLNADCWDDHLPTGWSFLGSQSCDGFFEIGKGNAIRLVESNVARSGNHALQITYSDQENPDDNIGQAVYHLPEETDYVKTTQYMRFNDTHDFAFGQKIHRLYSAGSDGFLNFDMVVNAWGRTLEGRNAGDMTGINGTRALSLNYGGGRDHLDWGTAESGVLNLGRERWYKITSEVQLNTVGDSNGWVRLFLDDVLVAEKMGLEIRASADHRFNRVMFGGWYSNEAARANPSFAPAAPTSLLIDDVSIVTSPGEEVRPLQPPQITAPTETVNVARPEIRWSAVANADGYDIRVINAANNSEVFTTQVQTTNVTPNADLANGTYTVSVRARAGAQVSPWANAEFTVSVSTGRAHFSEDFEGLNQTCWDEHLTTASGFSHALPTNTCDGFYAIGEGDSIRRIQSNDARSGTHALQITYQQNEDQGQAVVPIQGTDYIRTSQAMYFGSTFDFGAGQKIHRTYSVSADESTNFDIVVVVWGAPNDGKPDGDLSGTNDMQYVSVNYNGDRHQQFDWGAAWNYEFGFERERWYEITTEIKLNTVGQVDGFVRLYVDGAIVAQKTGIEIRGSADDQINRVLYGGWYSNGAGGKNPQVDPASPTVLLIDDVSFTTTPGAPEPQIIVMQTQGSTNVAEGGTTDSFALSLSAEPAQNVVLQIGGGDGQVEVSAQTVTFTPANWDVPQNVSVTAIDDDVVEAEQQVGLTVSVAAGSDPAWINTREQSVNVTVTDNDQRQDVAGWQDGILVLPGDGTQNYRLSFDWTERRGEYDNELGFFVAEDISGRVDGLLPTNAGYAEASLRAASREIIFTSGAGAGAASEFTAPGGSRLVFFMVQNATTDAFLADNAGNDFAQTPRVFLSLTEGNPDDFNHVHVTGGGADQPWQFAWEDIEGGGDQSFTDAVIDITVHEVSGRSPEEVDRIASQIAIDHELKLAGNDFRDWGGRDERWLRGKAGWYFITPEGILFLWDGSGPGMLTGTQVERLDSRYHTDLMLFFKPTDVPSGAEGLIQLDQTLGFNEQQNYWQNWGSRQEKWFRASRTSDWYFLEPDGDFFRWTGGGRSNLQGELVTTLSSLVYVTPSLLHEATAIDVDARLGLDLSGDYYEDWGGLGEKWLKGTDGWYYLTPTGQVYRWNSSRPGPLTGTLQAELEPRYHQDPSRLHEAYDSFFSLWDQLVQE